MTPRELEEYRSLRATILQRGTQRVWLALGGLGTWAALALLVAVTSLPPVSTLLPLLVLAATFESVYAVHTAVERVGRYIQVYYEADGAGWEHVAMAYGRTFRGGGFDPLFCAYFWSATILNLLPMLLAGPVPVEWVVVGLAHLLVIGRVASARRAAAGQRARDLERFTQLRSAGSPPA